MGMSTNKTKTTPAYPKEMTGAATDISNSLHTQNPKATAITDALGGLSPSLLDRYNKGDPNVNAASRFNTDVLGGKFLNSNPYLDQNINSTNNDVRNQTQAAMGVHGNWGNSSAMADIVSRNIANNDGKMRMDNYNTGLGMMGQQSALAGEIANARYQPIEQMNNIAQAQSMPIQNATGAGSGIGGLLGQYTNTTQKQGAGGLLAGMLGAGLSGWASGGFKTSDIRAKEDIRAVGTTNEGLTIYTYRYTGQPEIHMGPMAQEVAVKQPENLGPTVGGYMTVNMAGVR